MGVAVVVVVVGAAVVGVTANTVWTSVLSIVVPAGVVSSPFVVVISSVEVVGVVVVDGSCCTSDAPASLSG